MNAKILFPDTEDRSFIKKALDIFEGTIIKITDKNNKIIYLAI
jgi:hypothetical protein